MVAGNFRETAGHSYSYPDIYRKVCYLTLTQSCALDKMQGRCKQHKRKKK